MVLRARQRELADPAALLLISPWTDMTFAYHSVKTNQASDVLFGGQTPMDLHGLAMMFLGPDSRRKDPLASPAFADLTGMPPTASSNSFQFDAGPGGPADDRRARPMGQTATRMMAGRAPEADEAITRIAEWLRPPLFA